MINELVILFCTGVEVEFVNIGQMIIMIRKKRITVYDSIRFLSLHIMSIPARATRYNLDRLASSYPSLDFNHPPLQLQL